MLNKKLTRRINKLLENKNINFKRKYFLLSTLASLKTNNKIMSEVDCFINSLINTNGKLPEENYLASLIKESLTLTNVKNSTASARKLIELNNLINPKKESLAESSILEELDDSLNISSYNLDKKLKEVLIESISKKLPLFLNEAGKMRDASEFLDDYLGGEKVSVPQGDNRLETYIEQPTTDVDDYEESEDERSEKKDLKSQEKRILLDYDWLLKKSKIPFIRNKLKFYLPVGSDADYIGPNLEKIPNIDKLAIVSLYKLIVEQNATNSAMRKWNIIHKIQYYLDIQQKFMDAEIASIGERDIRKNKKAKFTSSPSGLDADQKRAIKSEVYKIIAKINKSNMSSLNSKEISESDLVKLLKRASGTQSKDVEDYMKYLNFQYPDSQSSKTQEVLTDEEYEKYILGNEEFDEKMRLEDEDMYGSSPVDPETGEPLYADEKTAQRIRSTYKKPDDDLEEIEMTSKEALALFNQNALDLKIADKLIAAEKVKALSPAAKKALKDSLARLSDTKGVSIKVLPDKTKGELHMDLLDAMDHMEGINSIDPNTGRITSKDWEKFVEDNIDVDNPMSHADIARVSQGAFRNTGGVRQDLTKQWFKSMFFSADLSMKSEIYAILGKKYIDAIRGMGLIEDAVITLPGISAVTKSEEENFSKIESLITSKEKLKEYFSGYDYGDDEDYTYLNELIGGLTSFRIFVTWFLKDFYANNVWNKSEAALAYAVKEYFSKNHPSARIGENLKPGRQSKHVKHEFGKALFNKIIYVVMGRTGIKDKGKVLVNPTLELEERKEYLKNTMIKAVDEFNRGQQANKIQNFDINHLVNDCLGKSSNTIIGKVWEHQGIMSTEDQSLFLDYIKKKKTKDFELKFIESALMREYYEKVLKNPLAPLGNPSEISAIEKGKGSESPVDKGKPESFTGSPYWYKLWKETTKKYRKDLSSFRDKKAKEREEALTTVKDYNFLEDDMLNINSWQVIYKGKPVEVKDSVDIDSGKLEIIIDILNSNGEVIDGQELEVSINEVLPIK